MPKRRDFMRTVSLVPGELLPLHYEIDLDDIHMLYHEIRSHGHQGVWNVIKWCLCFGYVMGHRATKNGTYKEVSRKRTNPADGRNVNGVWQKGKSTTTVNKGRVEPI